VLGARRRRLDLERDLGRRRRGGLADDEELREARESVRDNFAAGPTGTPSAAGGLVEAAISALQLLVAACTVAEGETFSATTVS
jgi:hypothetical protein